MNEVQLMGRASSNADNMKKHMPAIYRMHGDQEATMKRYWKKYNLVDSEFARMRERGHDQLLLQEKGALVVECILRKRLQRYGPEMDVYD